MSEDFELTLQDRMASIRDFVTRNGEGNFYLSFSGGKDSTILSAIIDEAIPGNSIPRVYCDTGIEYRAVRDFVMAKAESDPRVSVIRPNKPIKATLEAVGYPFKSKEHSKKLSMWAKGSRSESVRRYAEGDRFACPKKLRYQFSEGLPFKVSDRCCYELKKKPFKGYERSSGRRIAILGLRSGEGGQRANHPGCVVYDKRHSPTRFKPLNPVSDAFMEWYAETRGVSLCELYRPPYSFERTGCKGCPYAIKLQEELNRMPEAERRQCEIIWKPVYEEYRRIGYRLGDSRFEKSE